MRIDFSALPGREIYQWMVHTILPRPIAWVSTISADGRTNLAPFSFFQGVSSAPPALMFVPVNSRDGVKKDTVRNIEAVPEFVVNLVSFALSEKMNQTSASLPHGESEFSAFDVASVPSEYVKPPRVADAPVSFECRLHQIVRLSDGPGASNIIFGLIAAMHVRDDVLGQDGMPDSDKLDLVGRMGGAQYTRTRDAFSLERPK